MVVRLSQWSLKSLQKVIIWTSDIGMDIGGISEVWWEIFPQKVPG